MKLLMESLFPHLEKLASNPSHQFLKFLSFISFFPFQKEKPGESKKKNQIEENLMDDQKLCSCFSDNMGNHSK